MANISHQQMQMKLQWGTAAHLGDRTAQESVRDSECG